MAEGTSLPESQVGCVFIFESSVMLLIASFYGSHTGEVDGSGMDFETAVLRTVFGNRWPKSPRSEVVSDSVHRCADKLQVDFSTGVHGGTQLWRVPLDLTFLKMLVVQVSISRCVWFDWCWDLLDIISFVSGVRKAKLRLVCRDTAPPVMSSRGPNLRS